MDTADINELSDFLEEHGLSKYFFKFSKYNISTMKTAAALTDDEMSIIFPIETRTLGDRILFKNAIGAYKEKK